MACLLSACASPKICARKIPKSDTKAAALLAASQRAHGAGAFAKIRDVSVRYDGRWASVGPRFQPVLADTSFRLGSDERLLGLDINRGFHASDLTGSGFKNRAVRFAAPLPAQ